MIITALIFKKLTIAQGYYVEISCNKIHFYQSRTVESAANNWGMPLFTVWL